MSSKLLYNYLNFLNPLQGAVSVDTLIPPTGSQASSQSEPMISLYPANLEEILTENVNEIASLNIQQSSQRYTQSVLI